MSQAPWGKCSQCGLCCLSGKGRYQCEHLEVITEVGAAGGTRCRVYKERWHGMAIKMIERGDFWGGAYRSNCDVVEEMEFEERRRNMPAGCTLVHGELPRD